MKHFSKIFAIILLAGIIGTATAQETYKFGHINSQELLMLMPERDSAQVRMEAYSRELTEQIEAMQVDYNNKLNTYQAKQATWTAAILEAKQKELQDMGVRIEEFQRTAQEDFQRMQMTLLRPINEKAMNAINKVGSENGFLYIFDISTGAVPFFNTAQSIDVLPMVKQELKIPADKKLPAAATTPSR
jgi:outer membrane protein